MSYGESVQVNPETATQIRLDIDLVAATLADIGKTGFDDFRSGEFAELDEHNPIVGLFIKTAFGKLCAEVGEVEAYRGLTGMLAAYHILTKCAGQPLPIRTPLNLEEAVDKAFADRHPSSEMPNTTEKYQNNQVIIEMLKLFSNPQTRRGASVIIQLFDDIIVK